MDANSDVAELIQAAVKQNRDAWAAIVVRYTPLLMSVLRGFRLSEADVHDIAQTVWLRLVEHLESLREPRALPGWLATTARNEAIKALKSGTRSTPVANFFDSAATDEFAGSVEDDLMRVQRREALLEAFALLNDRDRQLLLLLSSDPPLRYSEIAARLQISIGSIGPTRARALDKLRHSPALLALDAAMTEGW
jgi:RNA polymerase sigma factor (sigma-70 family)